ncbi:NAD-dependent epimerase/dehydratase family protein [Sphaerochaeta globosa]|uniref:NAD-dependent epimerase/dehydratase n=1 Tax=Sphaerochaeta globosa (strain ATCC BAA-1886 / DSM 22777 / Buddy) TaxID=158189 RepID=F0RXP4_SPHGB|nr:NAD-dependent epimerase/dehydratase family protein [Sphaerochaeta globosa]ADY12094.1 NAD-dependent epimerase/dehydratase [Sphaerochaeta globosa str. Buddy]
MKRILITGLNSYIGTNVERWLMREPDKYHVDTIDMIDGSWREKDFSGYDVVFHVAGIAHVNAEKNMEALYYKVNTDLTIETAAKAKASGVKQFIFMSSIIVYGESKSLKPVIITRETEPRPNGFYGNSKLQAEIGIRKLEDEHFKIAILRPPMIYGPGSKGNFPKLVALAKNTPIFPEFHNQRSMLYIDNLCEFVRLIIENKEQGVFFPQNEEYVDTCEVVRQVAKETDHRIWITRLLNPFVSLGALFIPAFSKVWGTLKYSQELSVTAFSNKQSICLSTSIHKTHEALPSR